MPTEQEPSLLDELPKRMEAMPILGHLTYHLRCQIRRGFPDKTLDQQRQFAGDFVTAPGWDEDGVVKVRSVPVSMRIFPHMSDSFAGDRTVVDERDFILILPYDADLIFDSMVYLAPKIAEFAPHVGGDGSMTDLRIGDIGARMSRGHGQDEVAEVEAGIKMLAEKLWVYERAHGFFSPEHDDHTIVEGSA